MTTMIRPIADTCVEAGAVPILTSITRNASNTCIGRRLRLRRTWLGVSEGELCNKLGIDRDDLNAYEQGAKRVSGNLLLCIAKLLDVRPDYFFRGYTAEELSACLESPL